MGLFNGGIFDKINKGLTKAWDVNVQGTKLVGSALFPGAGNYLSQMETNAANLKLQEQANRQNALLWQQQTAYNDPSAQMKRLEAAGLNPNLAYGQIADSKASSPPQMQAPRNEAPKFSLDSLSAFQQIMNMQEQNKLIREQANKVKAETAAINYETGLYKDTGFSKNDPPWLRVFGRTNMTELFKYLFYSSAQDRATMGYSMQQKKKD